ncbi:hypothetical protein CEE88_12050, partial [Lactobacillus crispatus]
LVDHIGQRREAEQQEAALPGGGNLDIGSGKALSPRVVAQLLPFLHGDQLGPTLDLQLAVEAGHTNRPLAASRYITHIELRPVRQDPAVGRTDAKAATGCGERSRAGKQLDPRRTGIGGPQRDAGLHVHPDRNIAGQRHAAL